MMVMQTQTIYIFLTPSLLGKFLDTMSAHTICLNKRSSEFKSYGAFMSAYSLDATNKISHTCALILYMDMYIKAQKPTKACLISMSICISKNGVQS